MSCTKVRYWVHSTNIERPVVKNRHWDWKRENTNKTVDEDLKQFYELEVTCINIWFCNVISLLVVFKYGPMPKKMLCCELQIILSHWKSQYDKRLNPPRLNVLAEYENIIFIMATALADSVDNWYGTMRVKPFWWKWVFTSKTAEWEGRDAQPVHPRSSATTAAPTHPGLPPIGRPGGTYRHHQHTQTNYNSTSRCLKSRSSWKPVWM